MVDKRIIEQVLAEQYEELVELQNVELCTRKEEAEIDLDSNLAQVVIGVRRSGKSTLCYNVLKAHKDKFAYVNFDDERFQDMQTSDLNTVLEVLRSLLFYLTLQTTLMNLQVLRKFKYILNELQQR